MVVLGNAALLKEQSTLKNPLPPSHPFFSIEFVHRTIFSSTNKTFNLYRHEIYFICQLFIDIVLIIYVAILYERLLLKKYLYFFSYVPLKHDVSDYLESLTAANS